ncbi:hypothetical protein K402DRAFT_112819 [Aulographum hederae CBS 113979]|uniref:Uncharacterized protein n=1 Tax=Aulographum hederae CBS 113979 TaxID=1176131 RepID=A0A6G1GWP8_9PEZI|nr:hypothetical protein K402DRAFT_112819 [Aulographum hederae CBS 113979]
MTSLDLVRAARFRLAVRFLAASRATLQARLMKLAMGMGVCSDTKWSWGKTSGSGVPVLSGETSRRSRGDERRAGARAVAFKLRAFEKDSDIMSGIEEGAESRYRFVLEYRYEREREREKE